MKLHTFTFLNFLAVAEAQKNGYGNGYNTGNGGNGYSGQQTLLVKPSSTIKPTSTPGYNVPSPSSAKPSSSKASSISKASSTARYSTPNASSVKPSSSSRPLLWLLLQLNHLPRRPRLWAITLQARLCRPTTVTESGTTVTETLSLSAPTVEIKTIVQSAITTTIFSTVTPPAVSVITVMTTLTSSVPPASMVTVYGNGPVTTITTALAPSASALPLTITPFGSGRDSTVTETTNRTVTPSATAPASAKTFTITVYGNGPGSTITTTKLITSSAPAPASVKTVTTTAYASGSAFTITKTTTTTATQAGYAAAQTITMWRTTTVQKTSTINKTVTSAKTNPCSATKAAAAPTTPRYNAGGNAVVSQVRPDAAKSTLKTTTKYTTSKIATLAPSSKKLSSAPRPTSTKKQGYNHNGNNQYEHSKKTSSVKKYHVKPTPTYRAYYHN
ncbi:hypothetical protein BU23DRAFT_643188 [Bimuria novae-zelandiae CBS 107.79]|uniref:Uncharacterized protein n=1 Tax=Bimuria novae-zelandiae CBS 107.79 TaxID=1447943 RepID=A0A6A5V6W8_9PLEO|nr:hypothetical protein BU23DRAFT_643188 [Bimuria novae-zelandiae CBS 107.79]